MTGKRQHSPECGCTRCRGFQPGNNAAIVKAGARSERVIAPRAAAVLEQLTAAGELPGYLDDVTFRPALLAYCRAEAVIGLLSEYVASIDLATATAGNLPILEQLRKWTATAASLRRSLGLDPMSRATLTRDLVSARAVAADAVAKHAAEGAAALERRGATEGER